MSELRTILQDYVATANSPIYNNNWEIINSKFPELANYDPQLLMDYVATANDQMYGGNWNIINSKFPELFPTANTPTYVAPKQKDYDMGDQKTQEDFINTEFWENEVTAGGDNRDSYVKEGDQWYYVYPEDMTDSRGNVRIAKGTKVKIGETTMSNQDPKTKLIDILNKEESDFLESQLETNVTYENVHLGENPFKSDEATNAFINYVNSRKGTTVINPGSDWEVVKGYLGGDLKQWLNDYTGGQYVNKDGETITTAELGEELQPSQDAYDYEYRNKYAHEGPVPIISNEEEREILGDHYDELGINLDNRVSENHHKKRQLGESVVMDRSKADPNGIIKPTSEWILNTERKGSVDELVIDGIFKENRPNGTKHYWKIENGKKVLLGRDGSPAEKHYE